MSLLLPVGCLLQSMGTELAARETGWHELTRLEILSDGRCHHIDVRIAPGFRLEPGRSKLRLLDRGKQRLAHSRWQVAERDLSGAAWARVHMPELRGGDRAQIRFTRSSDRSTPFHFDASGAAWAELSTDVIHTAPPPFSQERTTWGIDVPRQTAIVVMHPRQTGSPPQRTATLSIAEGLERLQRARILPDGTDPEALFGVAALARGSLDRAAAVATLEAWTSAEIPPLAPCDPCIDVPVQVSRTWTLDLPGADPHADLWPGGGSSVLVEDHITIPADTTASAWHLPLPARATEIHLSGSPAYLRQDSILWLVPAEAGAETTVSYRFPDAPACGPTPTLSGADLTFLVSDPLGQVETDAGWWWLSSHEAAPVLPSREEVLTGLDYRFRVLSMPEPGLPFRLRGRTPDWDVVASLRAAVFDRARPARTTADWPFASDQASVSTTPEPLWPRHLYRARKQGALTPLEAALILRLYVQQARVPADWLLVRPAHLGPGSAVCPVGYDEAVVAVHFQGETRFIDPSCSTCAPFELRPHLEGASAFGRHFEQTPPPTPGSSAVEVGGDVIRWSLSGPAALELRMWLEGVAPETRVATLATQIGGPGAELTSVTGIEIAGGPITLEVRGELAFDPLAVQPWARWVGDRSWARPGATVDSTLSTDSLSYRRVASAGRIVEVLSVHERDIGAALEDLRAARMGPSVQESDIE